MLRTLAALLMVVVAALLTAGPAAAHGGPIRLEVQGDGGQGVNASVIYQNDGHMVTDEVVLSYTAVTADGRTAGPVRMIASAEGQAFYQGEKPLPLGTWTVTVTATKPSSAQKTVAVTSAALPQAPAAAMTTSSSTPTITIIVLGLAVVTVAGAAFVVLRRRTARRT
jgi:hypothetical protein